MPKLPNESFSDRIYHEAHDPNYLVIKGNPLVQQSHYSMSLEDTKVLASLIRSIKPHQKNLTVEFSTKRFIEMLGLKKDSNNFDHIMATIRNVSRDNFWMRQPDGKYRLWQWLSDAVANPHSKEHGNFVVTFNPALKKYLLNQSLRYRTIYKFSDIMLMKSRYSPRLYEIFRSNQSRQKVQKRGLNYSIAELKYSLNLMHYNRQTDRIKHDKDGHIKFMYPRFADFRRKVITPSVKEINTLTEYNVKLRAIKHSRKVIGFNVVMTKKNKHQKQKRDDLIYCITHHIPKSEWATWREDKIRGKFHQVHGYHHKQKHALDGKFHVLNRKKQPNKVKLFNPITHEYVWVDNSAIASEVKTNKKSDDNESTSTLSDQEINKRYTQLPKDSDGYVKIYNPAVEEYVWTTKSMAIPIIKGHPHYNK